MDSNKVLQSNYLDIIFDGRNKYYGSYQLRVSYPARMLKAGSGLFVLTVLLLLYNLWSGKVRNLPELPLERTTPVQTIINVELDIPKEPLLSPAQTNKTAVKTEMYLTPDIVENVAVKPEDRMATQEQLKDAVAGPVRMEGTEIGDESLDDIVIGDPNGSRHMVASNTSKRTTEDIPVFVEQMPEFPGGEKELMKYLTTHLEYPLSAQNARQEGKVQVKFVINEDGSVSNIAATRDFGFGSAEESVRVVSGMPKWKPGRNNGRAVKVWFYLPLIFKLN